MRDENKPKNKYGYNQVSQKPDRFMLKQTPLEHYNSINLVIDKIPDIIFIKDLNGVYLGCNNEFAKHLGRNKEEIIGKTDYDIYPAEEAVVFRKHDQEAIDQNMPRHYEEWITYPDGRKILIDTIKTPYFGPDGKLVGVLGISRDITERKEAEEALKNSERELKTITNNMTDIVAMFDVKGRFTYISESNYRLLGYKPSYLLGKTIFELIHEDDLAHVGAIYPEKFAEGCGNVRTEYRVRNINGEYLWVETIGSLILDDNGQPSGALFTSRDISERKKVEETLHHMAKQYETLWESSAVAKMLFDYNTGDVIKANNKALQMFGMKVVSEFERFNWGEPPYSKADVLRIIDDVKNMGELRYEWETVNITGEKFFVEVLSQEIEFNGEKTIMSSFTDITERKKSEEHIRYIGYHDKLTNLYNRHYFEKCVNEIKETPVISVIITDINGLKLVNDTYGHEAGDELLRKYANLMKQSFKHSDLIFRWGGDEFIAILKNTEQSKSWELCNRLIEHCGETLVKDIPLSISVGISSKLQGEDIGKAIREAEDMMYKNKLTESKSSKNLIMKTLLQTLSEKSFETKEHIDRMSLIGRRFGAKLSLPPSELSRLETLTMLHDIGKINIDSHILLKETTLTDKDWEEIKKHPEVGYRITRTAEEFAYIADEILAHHERWDGKGYPRGLEGKSIPYLARILSLVDSYDVMSNGRPYKPKMSDEQIACEMESFSGKQFDPEIVDEFIACIKEGF